MVEQKSIVDSKTVAFSGVLSMRVSGLVTASQLTKSGKGFILHLAVPGAMIKVYSEQSQDVGTLFVGEVIAPADGGLYMLPLGN